MKEGAPSRISPARREKARIGARPGSLADVNRPIEQPAQLRVGAHRAQVVRIAREKISRIVNCGIK